MSEMEITVTAIRPSERHYPIRYSRSAEREYREATRIYVQVDGESLWDNIANRRRRPHDVYRKHVLPKVRAAFGLDEAKIRWSKHAGCRMCPCSPGFILDRTLMSEDGKPFDIWVTIVGEQHPDDYDPQLIAAQVMNGVVVDAVPGGES